MSESYIVISADTHVCPEDFDTLLSYVDPAHREAIAEFGEHDPRANVSKAGGRDPGVVVDDDPVRELFKWRLAAFGVDVDATSGWIEEFTTDTIIPGDGDGRRLEILESQGVHGEVAYPFTASVGTHARILSDAMLGDNDTRWAASHAYNRWLADFASAAPGRRAGCIKIELRDIPRTVQEIEWARESGLFGGIMLPHMSLDTGLPGYSDEYYDPVWAACVANDMPVIIHIGLSATDHKHLYDEKHGPLLAMYESMAFTRRPVWFLMMGGVFDRHPGLKVVIAEDGSHWVPSLLLDLEKFWGKHAWVPARQALELRPTEYFRRNIYIAGSLMQRHEAELRGEIGLHQLMWGADYPHLEGTFPNNRDVMRHVVGGLPEDDIRRILGGNALDLWDFDEAALREAADRCGPTVEDLASHLPEAELPGTFAWNVQGDVPMQLTGAGGAIPTMSGANG
jgi:predicted TIM-barrel fold metal-dependent hydrolase